MATSLTDPRSSKPALVNRLPRWAWDLIAYAPAAASVPAAALGLAGLLGRGPRFLRDSPVLSGLLVAGAVGNLVRWQLERVFTEQPTYEVERRIGAVEIRRYAPRVIAETTIDTDDWDQAREEGFRRLAGYIFGGNHARTSIDMTAPVTSERVTIDMTAPVTTQRAGRGITVGFQMPRTWTLATLPVPDDARVTLREVPAERVAVRRYRGSYDAERTAREHARLLAELREAGLSPTGEPRFAGYDAPSTLPFLRRVEAMVPV